MKYFHRSGQAAIALVVASASLLCIAPQAVASSWGGQQTVNNWNKINARWTANNELETYTPACVWYEGSTLVIKTYKSGSTYFSGRVESNPTYGYGTYSFTANFPNGQGLLPAVWAAHLSPWLPEMDAAEMVGQNPNTVYQTFHDWNNNQTSWSRSNYYANGFHVYSFTYWPDHIDYWVDGGFTGTAWYTVGAGVNMHFIVDTAVGGNWPGPPNASTWATSDGARYLKCSAITYQQYFP